MAILITFLTFIYVLCVIGLTVFSTGVMILLGLWWRHRRKNKPLPHVPDENWPDVTVQLPVYNEYAVIKRLVGTITGLDYPRDRLHIQILDDSDDDTYIITAQIVLRYRQMGFDITHVQRPERVGYKAGALAYGLQYTQGDFIAIFDADFVPAADFLRRTIPYLIDDPRLGILQTRWGHLNTQQNFITRVQAMSIDRHFVIEQTARNRGGLLLSFNGSGGIWRRACIEDAGGWSGGTITEDLDLSYRAQMCGWHYLYLPDIEVRAELPPQIAAFKRQQARWAKGTTQNLLRLAGQLWRNKNLTLLQKYMGTLHLAQYLPQLMLLIMTLLTPILMVAGTLDEVSLAQLGFISLLAPMMYVISQWQLYPDWMGRLVAFPVLLLIGSGITFNNSVAILEAMLHRPSVFKRTPKFSDRSWQASRYVLHLDWTLLFEVLLAVYTCIGGIIALQTMPRIAPFLFGQACGFATLAGWALLEELKIGFNWLYAGRSTTPSTRQPPE